MAKMKTDWGVAISNIPLAAAAALPQSVGSGDADHRLHTAARLGPSPRPPPLWEQARAQGRLYTGLTQLQPRDRKSVV